MPLTRPQKKNRNISDLGTYAIASKDLIDAKFEAFETCMEDKLRSLFAEFRLGRLPSPTKLQQGESPDHKENPPEKEEHATNPASTRIRVDFHRWEDGDPTVSLLRTKRYFHYHRTLEAFMVDITAIHLEGDVIQ
ncbi:hypothetical protein B296_00002545 [Ensete ventricosum]|uniref:Uncharacterized protein n=1 Tax=Ensete ventricosum TaxID=4639 RepID=A0A427AYU0_ENSVE|nr:hypothetical protein B296_00002545 [Ensete ventricosum]